MASDKEQRDALIRVIASDLYIEERTDEAWAIERARATGLRRAIWATLADTERAAIIAAAIEQATRELAGDAAGAGDTQNNP